MYSSVCQGPEHIWHVQLCVPGFRAQISNTALCANVQSTYGMCSSVCQGPEHMAFTALCARVQGTYGMYSSVCQGILLCMRYVVYSQGRVDDLSFFDYLSPFCFLLIEFHYIFSISCKIIPLYVY